MLMENAVRMELFGQLSGRRLFRELVLCLTEEKPLAVIKRLRDYGLLKSFHPKIKVDRVAENLLRRLESVLSWYNLLFTGERYERWLVVFLGLVDALAEKEIQELFDRLSLSEKYRMNFLQHRGKAIQVVDRISRFASLGRSDIYFLLNPLPTEFLLYGMGKTESGTVKKALSLYFTGLKPTRISLNGQDLTQMGYAPGPIYAEILQELLRAKLDGELHSHQEEMEYVQEKFARTPHPLRA
jgi:tRNA nucleotidyltransferase (CCA-adding enzyme)